jgi:hypothetical protein
MLTWNKIITKSASLSYFLLSAYMAKKSYQSGAGIFKSAIRGIFSPLYAIKGVCNLMDDEVLGGKDAQKKANHSDKKNQPQNQNI